GAAFRGLRAREGDLRLLRAARGQVRHPEVVERRRRRRALARAAQRLDRAVVLAPLVVDPSESRERVRLQLLRRRRERAARVVERQVEILAGLGEARRELVVADGLCRLRGVALEELAEELRRLAGVSLRAQGLGERRAGRRRDHVLRIRREYLAAG